MHILPAKPIPSQDALIAAGLVLEHLGPNAPIARVAVNGERVADVAAARAAFATASKPPPPRDPNVIDRIVDWVARNVDKLESRLLSSENGRKLHQVIMADPERVTHRVAVEVELESGRIIKKDVDVLDREATHFLQSASAIAELASMIPIPGAGSVFTGLAALAAIIGARFTRASRKDLSRALAHTAAKHGALAAVGWIPIVSNAPIGFATAMDYNDVRHNRAAAPASLVENLGAPRAA